MPKKVRGGTAWAGAPILDAALERAEVSNVDLAQELGVEDSTISRYRSGHRPPPPDVLAHMCRRAGISADEVLGLRPMGSVASRSEMHRQLDQLAAQVEQMRRLAKN